MDGWESRRRRTEGYDWCIIKLGMPGHLYQIEVDTAFFTGNNSPMISVQGIYYGDTPAPCAKLSKLRHESNEKRKDGRMGLCASDEEMKLVRILKSEEWTTIVPLQKLSPGYEDTRKTVIHIQQPGETSFGIISHIRVNMGPDGGIARLRAYGQVHLDTNALPKTKEFDLAAVQVILSSSTHTHTHAHTISTYLYSSV